MAQPELFHVSETQDIPEAEYLKLKNQLFSLRRRYIQRIWASRTEVNVEKLQPLEEKIGKLEDTLAHAHVVR